MKRTCEFHPADELIKERLCNQKVVSKLNIILDEIYLGISR